MTNQWDRVVGHPASFSCVEGEYEAVQHILLKLGWIFWPYQNNYQPKKKMQF